MKNVIIFLVLFTVSIAKPTDEQKGKEKSLQNDSLDVFKANYPGETIISKRRPFIIKSKISKPNTKKRNIGSRSKPKALVAPDSGKSAITFALDSDDKSLSSIISVILKLLESDELAEIDSKQKNTKSAHRFKKPTVTISENPTPSTEVPNTILESNSIVELLQSPHSEQYKEKYSTSTETIVAQTTVSPQISSQTTKSLNSDLPGLTTTPSNIILETSVSFEPLIDNISDPSKKNEQGQGKVSGKPVDKLNNDEESSGDFSTESDEDSKHYCPDDLKDEDKTNTDDSATDLEKLISTSAQKQTSAPALQPVSESNSEMETETPTLSSNTLDNTSEFLPETEATTLEPLDIETCQSETTTISSNILTDLEEILTTEAPLGISNEIISTTVMQSETTTLATFLHNKDNFNETPTEQETAALFTTSEPKNDEKAETTVAYNEILTLPSIPEPNKLDSSDVTEITTNSAPYKDTTNELPTTTEPVLMTTAITNIVSWISSSHELSDKAMTSQYASTPISELPVVESMPLETVKKDENLEVSLKQSAILPSSEATVVISEATPRTEPSKFNSTPSSVPSLDVSTVFTPTLEIEVKQENPVESQKTTFKSTKPHSRLITFTLYDRKEKYTSLKHFIDYLKTLKK